MQWIPVCDKDELIPDSGICVKSGSQQIALFCEGNGQQVYAVDNLDPVGKANVISRGLLGSAESVTYVASPLLKHRFDLKTGICLDDENLRLRTWQVRIQGNQVEIRH